MNLSKNFTLQELTYSRTTIEHRLENVAGPLQKLHLCAIISKMKI